MAGDRIENGRVLVAGTNDHLVIKEDRTLGIAMSRLPIPTARLWMCFLRAWRTIGQGGVSLRFSLAWEEMAQRDSSN